MRVTVIAGGVGSARMLAGLARVLEPSELTVVVNTGDDERMRGLHVSPDVDTVLYHLAGLEDWERGWGTTGESYAVHERYTELVGHAGDVGVDLQEWFTLGDRDLATNLLRTRVLDAGLSLSEATDAVRRGLGVPCRVLPATDDPLRTVLVTTDGDPLDFQEYFVRRRQEPAIGEVRYVGADAASPAPGVLDALAAADVVVVPPSNPLLSIGPILAIDAIREALADATAVRVAVSPIVGGRALKGPADLLMASLGHDVSALGVARIVAGLVDLFVLDERDAGLSDAIAAEGVRPLVLDTLMRSPEDAARLAKAILANVV